MVHEVLYQPYFFQPQLEDIDNDAVYSQLWPLYVVSRRIIEYYFD